MTNNTMTNNVTTNNVTTNNVTTNNATLPHTFNLKIISLAFTMVLVACSNGQSQTPITPNTTLTETDISGLVWMLEEEKLAHDVYITLYDTWGIRMFDNISRSEAQHMSAVQGVLERYHITVPHLGNIGVFNDPTLQTLYHDLIAQGQTSLEEALRVGAFIEELDIDDLNIRSAQTDNADIRTVYDNLNRGSRNHLRSFVNQLSRYGITYEPQVLEVSNYQTIINGTLERGASH